MSDYSADIRQAVECMRRGGVILYPTDTVWGLGCDACNSEAVRRIFEIKKRADSKALITLVGSEGQLERTVAEVPEVAWQLIEYSDRPLTIVYDGASPAAGLAPELLGTDGTIGVRLTREAFSSALCRAMGKPIVSTSANESGKATPTVFAEIESAIPEAVDYVCSSRRDEPAEPARKPSMVMRLSADGQFKILRS